jgi:DNA (cytosine-5)-methyltransferase 1
MSTLPFTSAADPRFLIVDLFCGAGGTTTGFAMAGGIAKVIACVNHDAKAIESHWKNHPEVVHFEEDIRTLDLTELTACVAEQRMMHPDAHLILWASLECTNFSKAKGGQPRDADSRTLADHLHRYVEAINPDYVQIENVVEFMSWGPLDENGKPVSRRNGADYLRWCREMCAHGYRDEWRELNSADFGAYTSRSRLFGVFAKPGMPIAWPEPTHARKNNKGMFGSLEPWRPVKEVLDFSDEGQSIFGRKKDLSEKTLERIYAGLVKFIAGGKDNFLAKIYAVASNSSGTYHTESAAHTITTRDAHALVQTAFLSKYNGENAYQRNKSLEEPCDTVITRNAHALVQTSFLSKQFGGNPDDKNISLNGPAGTVTCIDHHAMVNAAFIHQRNNGNPEGRAVSIDGPARTLTTTGGNQDLVQPKFLLNYHHSSKHNNVDVPCPAVTAADKLGVVNPEFLAQYYGTVNVCNTEGPAPTITTKDRISLVQPQFFIDKQYGSGPGNQISIDQPTGSILGNDKHALITAEQAFVMPTNFDNKPTSIDEPLGTVTANRKWHYLINPSWYGFASSTDQPCPVIIARQDKAPLYVVCPESGDVAIRVDESDSPCARQIKEFMALYGIIDIKMRMLKVRELLSIQGFPADYHLAGNQSDQKKFIGNSVVPLVVKAWVMAMASKVNNVNAVAA